MRRTLFVAMIATLLAFSTFADGQRRKRANGTVVVANRASGTVSVIDVQSDQVTKTVPLPGTNTAEPMYVVFSKARNRILVGDRANDQVVALNRRDYSVDGIANVGKGVFHMWEGGAGRNRQLWVNNDVDNTTSVVDSRTLRTLATINTPMDIVAAGGKPHDVFVPSWGNDAYVSYIGLTGTTDVVVQFSIRTRRETGRVSVGKDPHLFVSGLNVYVASQNTSEVAVFRRWNLRKITSIPVPNAHGIWGAGRHLYVTNISGGGTDGLVTIDVRTNTVVDTEDAPFAVPHNVVVVGNGRRAKAYVSHSGATADKVSVYDIGRRGIPQASGSITVGMNPFGIAGSR